ncbi:DNA sulfur modification protein DndB [Empedobacter brevis]|uniref:DNA sulfur modification protein DndB n=1 Tax=Empedobacter brevis TaxID=247 RepID=UPI00289D017E|nr:DNA sulfur modification protein DndB [Empedobacter brevis]
MKTHTINVNKINQFDTTDTELNKGVYNAIIPFEKIVKSIKFTHRQSPSKGNDEEYFQRLTSDSRVLDIIEFLIKQSETNTLISFPLNFILSIGLVNEDFNSVDEYLKFIEKEDIENEFKLSYIAVDKNEIIIPEIENILIVDGQHRLAALKYLYYGLIGEVHSITENIDLKFLNKVKLLINKVYESFIIDNKYKKQGELEKNEKYYVERKNKLLQKIKDFTICATLLVDFDIYEQAKVFADVNFNQKPVNKSLYYDIYGSFPNEDHNDIYIVHNWCKHLNEDDDSVLKNKIKMLGNGDGFISQAFMCDELLPLVRKGGIWADIMNDYLNDRKDETEDILIFLKEYFKGVSKAFENLWPTNKAANKNTILLKTTGIGALIKLIPDFYKEYGTRKDISENIRIRLKNLTKGSKYYFSKDEGNFAIGAGKSLQKELFKELREDLKFQDKTSQLGLFSL